MERKTVEKNISYDDVRKCYYVALYFGKDNEGKKIQTYATASSLKKARTILKDHRRKMEAGTATPPAKDTLPNNVLLASPM